MRTVQHHGPYYIGGYRFGGLIAFEIAHQLKKAAEDVALLAILEPRPLRSYGFAHSETDNRGDTETPKERVSRHINMLKTLGMAQSFHYVSERVWRTILAWTHPASTLIKKVVCGPCIRYGLTLPVFARSFHILSVYRQAGKDYKAQAYPGTITLFARELSHISPSTWDGLADGVQIQKVTGERTPLSSSDNLIWRIGSGS
jgi:hypothetical protein